MKKITVLLAVLVATALVGCSKQPDKPNTTVASETTAQEASKPKQKYKKPQPVHVCLNNLEEGTTPLDEFSACLGRQPNSFAKIFDHYLYQYTHIGRGNSYHIAVKVDPSTGIITSLQSASVH